MEHSFYRILNEHAARYPLMKPQDYGKLIFQSEFGPNHMIMDRQSVLSFLTEEWKMVRQDGFLQLPEAIGGGLCRFPLSACPSAEATELLADLFLLTAKASNLTSKQSKGKTEGIRSKLELLKQLEIPGMEEWAADWGEKGFPPVHHSREYRDAYQPHYRLLKKEYAGCFSALLKIRKLMKEGKPVIVGIDGRCGSGKTHFAKLAGQLFSCNILHMDDFYLPPGERPKDWREIPGGNMDFGRFRSEILFPAKSAGILTYRPYNCQKGELEEAISLQPLLLTVIEGSYSHHPLLADQYDLKLFLTCSGEEQARRLRLREGNYFSAFEECWIPMEENYFQSCAVEAGSSLVIDTTEFLQ